MCMIHLCATLLRLAGCRQLARTDTVLSSLSVMILRLDYRNSTHLQRQPLIMVISPGKPGRTSRMAPSWPD